MEKFRKKIRRFLGHWFRIGKVFLSFLVKHPAYALSHRDWLSHWSEWISSLDPYSPAPFKPEVWVTFAAREWFDETVTKEMRVFEYGSGGSTLFFAARALSVVSVEHHREWSEELRQRLQRLGIENVDLRLVEPIPASPAPYSAESFRSTFDPKLYGAMSFEQYVRVIEEFPDESFDLVFIDGRSRLSCVKCALPKVRAGGYLVLDNSERPDYEAAFSELLAPYPRQDFEGLAPRVGTPFRTSVWRIEK